MAVLMGTPVFGHSGSSMCTGLSINGCHWRGGAVMGCVLTMTPSGVWRFEVHCTLVSVREG